jgi:hypothetical protein
MVQRRCLDDDAANGKRRQSPEEFENRYFQRLDFLTRFLLKHPWRQWRLLLPETE